jgi:hypothetical protein
MSFKYYDSHCIKRVIFLLEFNEKDFTVMILQKLNARILIFVVTEKSKSVCDNSLACDHVFFGKYEP